MIKFRPYLQSPLLRRDAAAVIRNIRKHQPWALGTSSHALVIRYAQEHAWKNALQIRRLASQGTQDEQRFRHYAYAEHWYEVGEGLRKAHNLMKPPPMPFILPQGFSFL